LNQQKAAKKALKNIPHAPQLPSGAPVGQPWGGGDRSSFKGQLYMADDPIDCLMIIYERDNGPDFGKRLFSPDIPGLIESANLKKV